MSDIAVEISRHWDVGSFVSELSNVKGAPSKMSFWDYFVHNAEIHERSIATVQSVLEQLRDVDQYMTVEAPLDWDVESMPLQEIMVAEILAKILVYYDVDGREINIPVKQDGVVEMVKYKVEKVSFLNSSLYFYGLIPIDNHKANPMVIFPGTQLYPSAGMCMVESLMADFCAQGIGWEQFMESGQGKVAVEKWLSENCMEKSAVVMGHSLGAAFAAYTAANIHQFVKKVINFAAPGVNKTTYRQLQALGESLPIFSFNAVGDPITLAGQHYFGKFFEIQRRKPTQGIMDTHGSCHLLERFHLVQRDVKHLKTPRSYQVAAKVHEYGIYALQLGLAYFVPGFATLYLCASLSPYLP